MQAFKDLFSKVLTLGKVNPKFVPTIVEKHIEEFKQAFVDSSIDPVNNYEVFEFVGDSILGFAITDYINKNSKIKTVKWMSKLRLYLVSRKIFAHFSRELQLEKYIVVSDEKRQAMSHTEKERDKFYTDILESLVFVLADCIEKETGLKGPKYTVVYNFISTFLDKLDINSLTEDDIFDAKSILNDFYNRRKQNFSQNFHVASEGNITRVTINFTTESGDRQTLLVMRGRDRSAVEISAAKQAVKILRDRGYQL
jgi:dsRNA-specific ribonuclease